MRRPLAAATIIAVMLATPGIAYAQAGPADPLDVSVKLAAFFPWVVLVSSLLLSPGHHAAVKRLVPGLVTVLTSVVYFVVNGWPGLGAEVLTGIGTLSALSLTAYQPVSALLELLVGRSLNGITGPGLPIGPTEADGRIVR